MSDAESVKLIERDTLEKMYLKSLKFRQRNMEVWDFVKSKCGTVPFFLDMESDGNPEEFAFEAMMKEQEDEEQDHERIKRHRHSNPASPSGR